MEQCAALRQIWSATPNGRTRTNVSAPTGIRTRVTGFLQPFSVMCIPQKRNASGVFVSTNTPNAFCEVKRPTGRRSDQWSTARIAEQQDLQHLRARFCKKGSERPASLTGLDYRSSIIP